MSTDPGGREGGQGLHYPSPWGNALLGPGAVLQGPPGAWLFPNPRTGREYSESALKRLWDKTRKAAVVSKELGYKMDVCVCASGHSVASNLRASRADLTGILDHLGHADIRTMF